MWRISVATETDTHDHLTTKDSTMQCNQTWHNRIVTRLMYSGNGDFILDAHGNLCTRIEYDLDTFKSLPWAEHKIGDRLAILSREGWTLTVIGAQFILENCPPDKLYDERQLERVAMVHRA